ncbi:GNAT family N-acetyltransferase [Halopelagius longus]|uniref:GNAT family N-acetyltransferase n=1 Tax=Halopelagius longus TaxID=1236180 RepID=A0A1H0Y661_9EURY|nr:GNAT family N-acetyltransferase [Halopelagius longus]RDI72296.1 GNAT family N-acetyltransferase [Halopelagius longus]SDQ10553.1 Ribosomal protein S18 acetylase RimI [Halopelagius longus]
MELREPTSDETDRIREMVESSMTMSYRLSPQQIESIIDDQFDDDHLSKVIDSDNAVVFVAENEIDGVETAVAGIVIGVVRDGVGEIRWLLVDPEHQGAGVGTELFESAIESLRDQDVEYVRAATLEKNTEGEQFFEKFDYVRTEERTVELGDESLVEYVYTEPSAASDETDAAGTDAANADTDELEFPDTETEDGVRSATTDDGETVYIGTDDEDEESGTDAPFFVTYTGEEMSERYGYYCANCGSLDVIVDDMERMECSECGNSHASRSREAYDDSYL